MTLGSGQQSSLGLHSKTPAAEQILHLPCNSVGRSTHSSSCLLPPLLPETQMVQMFFHELFKALEEPF